jgi:hypothetical protein
MAVTFVPLCVGIHRGVAEERANVKSRWDEELLGVELRDVRIEGYSVKDAWFKMSRDLLLRSCFYQDVNSKSDMTAFTFKSGTATGGQVLQAFLAAYPAYTYTQDPATGVIWIHRKLVHYDEMFSEKVQIRHSATQVPMWGSVIIPLRKLLKKDSDPIVLDDDLKSRTFGIGVDLPSGVYSVKSILNMCLVQDPNVVFSTLPGSNVSVASLIPGSLTYMNPLVPPRPAAVRYWHWVMGDPANEVPTLEQVGVGLSDSDPLRRLGACAYLRLTQVNYHTADLFTNIHNPEKAIWEALAVRNNRCLETLEQFVTNDLPRLNASLALLACMQLALQKNDPSIMDTIASYRSSVDFSAIKPEFYRIVRSSKLVRDKLMQMKCDTPELSPSAVGQVGDVTDVFVRPSAGSN